MRWEGERLDASVGAACLGSRGKAVPAPEGPAVLVAWMPIVGVAERAGLCTRSPGAQKTSRSLGVAGTLTSLFAGSAQVV